MNPNYLAIGDTVAKSPVGAGVITGITDAHYPQVNGIAVAQLERTDGVVWAPRGIKELAMRTEPLPQKEW